MSTISVNDGPARSIADPAGACGGGQGIHLGRQPWLPGRPGYQIERLFVPFDRLGLQDGPGAGLGMVPDRGPTQAMGGTLSVRSTLGTGTTMHLRLPIA